MRDVERGRVADGPRRACTRQRREPRREQIRRRLRDREAPAERLPELTGSDARFLDKGFSEPYVPVQVLLAPQGAEWAEGRQILELELRPGQRQTERRRKRMRLFE